MRAVEPLTGFYLDGFTVDTYEDLGGLLAALVIGSFPTVVTIFE